MNEVTASKVVGDHADIGAHIEREAIQTGFHQGEFERLGGVDAIARGNAQ
jgi:hypothetical protein